MKTRSMGMRASGFLVLLGLTLLLTGAAGAQQGLTRVADDVYSYVDARNASPKNSFGANAGIVIGRHGILVVDTLVSAKEAARFIRDIRAVSDKPIIYAVNTHSHLDHTFGNSEFAKLGAIIIAHEDSRRKIEANGEATLKKARGYGLTDDDLSGTSIALPSVTFSRRMEIDLGGARVDLIYPGPSHTGGSILVHVPQKRVLFAGDALFTGYHPNLGDGDLANWLKALDLIASLDALSIIPGHGPVSGRKDISDMKDYIVLFDRKAGELAASSDDPAFITAELKKALPHRAELEFLIGANVQARYLNRDGEGKSR